MSSIRANQQRWNIAPESFVGSLFGFPPVCQQIQKYVDLSNHIISYIIYIRTCVYIYIYVIYLCVSLHLYIYMLYVYIHLWYYEIFNYIFNYYNHAYFPCCTYWMFRWSSLDLWKSRFYDELQLYWVHYENLHGASQATSRHGDLVVTWPML